MTSTVEVTVGVVGRPHGIRGEVVVDLRTDEPDRRLAVGAVLTGEPAGGGPARQLTVSARRLHNGRQLVTFAELTDRTAVEQARGTRLSTQVPSAESPSGNDEFFDRQLVGLRVLDHDGTDVGAVTTVLHLPGQDVLEVRTSTGTRLVPFVTAIVPDVDLDAGHLRLADVPGLLEDDEAETATDEGGPG